MLQSETDATSFLVAIQVPSEPTRYRDVFTFENLQEALEVTMHLKQEIQQLKEQRMLDQTAFNSYRQAQERLTEQLLQRLEAVEGIK